MPPDSLVAHPLDSKVSWKNVGLYGVCHAVRHDEFLQEIFEGRMKGKQTTGRKRIQLLDDLADGKDYASLKREAEDRSVWRIRQ